MRWLFDTNVLIDFLRNRDVAVRFLDKVAGTRLLSCITVAELYAGARPAEMDRLAQLVQTFEVIPLTATLAREAGVIKRDYHPSHGIGLADAVIAATAISERATLSTLNKKHFPMLKQVQVPYTL